MKTYTRVLTIAGSDSSAGAGIQADLKTISALKCYGMSVVTAITAQNTQSVSAIFPIPAEIIRSQLESVLSDMGVDAIKIGMLYSAEAIQAVAKILAEMPDTPIVLDPVLTAQSGRELLQAEALSVLTEKLMPLSRLITPNIPEAEILLRRPIDSTTDIRQICRDLSHLSSRYILLKGGHAKGRQCVDWLHDTVENRFFSFAENRIETQNDHGTGCTLSAAIAAFLARGESMEDAVAFAKAYVSAALSSGQRYTIGRGRGPMHHFHPFWK